MRMKENEHARRVLYAKPGGKQGNGRSRMK